LALVSTSFLAFNPRMIEWSQEFKPLMGDVFFILLLAYLTERLVAEYKLRNYLILIGCSIVAILFSHPVVFVFPAIFLRIMFRDKDIKGKIHHLVVYGATILAVFITNYWFNVKKNITTSLETYWGAQFLSSFHPVDILSFVVRQTYSFFPFAFRVEILFFILFLLGICYLLTKYRVRNTIFLYLCITLVFVIIASAFKRYPYGGDRPDLFIYPFLIIVIAYGIHGLVNQFRIANHTKVAILLLFILVPAVVATGVHFTIPRENEELRPVLEEYNLLLEDGDLTYIYYGAIDSYLYYTEGNMDNVVLGTSHRDNKTAYLPELDVVLIGRVWLIFSHNSNGEEQFMLEYASTKCEELVHIQEIDASAHLFLCHTLR
jgi:4-amino-4-deoxy-L-arabinose transferase-like glycosyltransferase